MTVLLRGVVGSTAYGLATADSDIDMIGTYVAPTRDVLGFGLSKNQQTRVQMKPDVTTHEIGKYVNLALACNPTIVELLWLEKYETETEAGLELVQLRRLLLSKGRVRDAYCGYAVQQANRLLRRHLAPTDTSTARAAKHGRHCYRLLTQCEELIWHGRLTVRLDPHVAARVWEFGEWAESDPRAFYDAMMAKAREIEDLPSHLPAAPQTDLVEKWLISVRLREMAGTL